ncbi:MAG TPA: prepilin-type N-terminal cleavage/methylation domain-containing protein [Candidatus Rifleibacterium sp.]|nr:prepilin-type N-terminal cleavage/methylation domain-containing protein [Candidatus Rifleibacterium sp.]HPT47521.1 prepilin-type N-terminal cleavage/methylation domain-containing protein [Candidatus Rifleibacterium sp.]
MAHNSTSRGVTLVEMMVVAVILTMLLGFAWQFYFGGRETMRHTVSQSQVQADTRILLDQLELEMTSCYSFLEIDSANKKFSFYSFTYSKVALDDIYYDTSGNPRSTGPDSDARIMVAKYEYRWENGTVIKKRTPGWLYFLQQPMKFVQGDASVFTSNYGAMEKPVLRNIADFEVKGYAQNPDRDSETGTKITPVTVAKSGDAAFIVLRLHTMKDEAPNQRDEELDIVTKFYSNTKLAEIANPGYFSSTDQDGKY